MFDTSFDNFPFVHKPFDHQLNILKRSCAESAYALFLEMGTGKSKIIIDNIAWLWLNGNIDTVLIIAKKGEYSNWRDVELPAHMPKEVDYVCRNYRSGMRSSERQALRDHMHHANHLRIVCVNVESLLAEGGKVAKFFVKTRKKGLMIVVDESTCVKNSKSPRSKAVYDLASFAKYRRILTGTPITRSPLDIWGQSLVLRKGILGHTSLYSFKGDYTLEEIQFLGTRHFKQVVGYKNLDRLQTKIKSFGTILERADCIDLPDKIYKKVVVEMTPEQQELYNQMRDEAIAELGDGSIVEAVNALGIISRLDQIACGQLKRPDGTFEIINSNRPDALVAQMEESTRKGIIWCNYRGLGEHLFDYLREQYGKAYVGRYYGGVSDSERAETLVSFQDPTNPLFWIVANQQSLGYGRTLTTGKNNYYYSNSHNLEHRLQSEDRTMRIGQDMAVLYTDFYTPGTPNERVMYLLRQKKNLAHEVLGTKITDWI